MTRIALAAAALVLATTTAAQGKTEVTWYGHAAFVVKTPAGTVIAIDPWLANPSSPDKEAAKKIPRVDWILVTHGHSDHVGDAIALATRTGAKLVTSFEMMQELLAAGYPKEQATMATSGNIGGTVQIGPDATATFVPALHSSSFRKDPSAPLESGGPAMGFVVQVKGGPTLYHTGDTAVTEEMRHTGERYAIDVMLACIGGHFTMDPEGAATAAGLAKAKAVVPMHFGTFPLLAGTPAQLEAALKARGSKAQVITMKPGESRAF